MSDTETQGPQVKIYKLLVRSKSPAAIYRKIAGQRVKVDERPVAHAHGKITFFDRKINKNRTIRLKLNCDSIELQEQIKQFNILANEKTTQSERDALKFRFETLVTDNPVVQTFLEASPEYDKNWELDPKTKKPSIQCNSIKGPKFTLLDEEAELDKEDEMFQLRVKAARLIAELNDLTKAQELMIRLNGSYFEAPDSVKKCRQLLISYLDEADQAMLNKILEKEVSADEQIRVLVGKAINYKIISFDAVEGKVVELSGKPNAKHKELKQISSEHSPETRLDMFVEFINSEDGKGMKQHLEKKVKQKTEK